MNSPELEDELHRIAQEGFSQAQPLPPGEVLRQGDRRRRRRIAAQCAVVVAVVAVAGGVFAGTRAAGGPAPVAPLTRSVPAPSTSPGGRPAPTPVRSATPSVRAKPSPSGQPVPAARSTGSPSPSDGPVPTRTPDVLAKPQLRGTRAGRLP
jgi:hypothetical protein